MRFVLISCRVTANLGFAFLLLGCDYEYWSSFAMNVSVPPVCRGALCSLARCQLVLMRVLADCSKSFAGFRGRGFFGR